MILALDTSGSETSVALSFANNEQSEQVILDQVITGSSHSDNLDCLVKNLLEQNSANIREIKTILLSAGPGSFTGLRIGFAFAKGLAMAINAKIGSYSSLMAAAYASKAKKTGYYLALDDARRGEYFAALFEVSDRGCRVAISEHIANSEQILEIVERYPHAFLVSANPTLQTVFPQLELVSSLASSLVRLYMQAMPTLSPVSSEVDILAEITPTYLRAVSALSIEERIRMGLISKGA